MAGQPSPITHSNKAVAVGAISYYVDRFVTGRISKFTYGAPYEVIYQPSNPEHVKRKHKSYKDASGDVLLPDSFKTMLARVRRSPHLIDLLCQIHSIIGYQGSTRPRNPIQSVLRD